MDTYLQFGKYTTGCPRWLLDKIQRIKRNTVDVAYVRRVLQAIREEFDPKVHPITTTHNFITSRFISVRDVVEQRQRSCGSLASVVAAVLRGLGIPTKLVDGRFIKHNPNMRHAWNEVLIGGQWVAFDVMQKDFRLTAHHVRKGEYVDWQQLEKSS